MHHHSGSAHPSGVGASAGPATWTFFDGDWHEGNVPIAGPMTHALWCGSSVFDGGRVFDGVAPDLLAHCERVNRSAEALNLAPTMQPDEIAALSLEGAKKFAPDQALYVRPMYFAESGGFMSVPPDPASTRFVLTLFHVDMPPPDRGMRVGVSSFRRPTLETMPTNAKAGCLYPNNGRAVLEVQKRGFDNALVLDMLGNVAELATANVFMARGGTVFTPAANGTFLAGITRARIMELLRASGAEVIEMALTVDDFHAADEIFMTGNYAKVVPITHFEGRDLQPGPFASKAREAYMAFAHDGSHRL
ncbi:MAG: branched-chain amino acid aminotransferase [Devosiaceae bacterium]|nr:branched-chain amino acid aminotransferase [Devosiaceae bacterium MH13]